jgi:hypothetical protein
MLSDNELGAKVKGIFHSPMTWQGQSAAIQALKPECGDPPDENVIGHPARNAKLLAKQADKNDTKATYRTAPGRKSELRDPPRYVEDEAPVDRGGNPMVKQKAAKKKSVRRKKAD